MHPCGLRVALAAVFALLLSGCVSTPPVIECHFPNEFNDPCVEELNRGNLDAAEAHCDLGVERYPRDPYLWISKGHIAMARKDWEAAEQHFTTALRLHPEIPSAYLDLGAAYLQQGAHEKAREAFSRALALQPESLLARYSVGLALMKLGDTAQARKELGTILAAPLGTVTASLLGAAHQTLGILDYTERNLDGAFAHLSRGVKFLPDEPSLRHDLGKVLMEQGRFAEAIEAFGHCVRLDAKAANCRDHLDAAQRRAAVTRGDRMAAPLP